MRLIWNGIGKISTIQRNKVNICGTGIWFLVSDIKQINYPGRQLIFHMIQMY